MTTAPEFSPKSVLVTGGAGFIGTNFVRLILRESDAKVVVLDSLTYAGNLPNLDGLAEEHGERFVFVTGDICDAKLVAEVMETHATNSVVHFAAESHVDRSIDGPGAFIQTNIMGTYYLLEAFRDVVMAKGDACRFHHVSTDEVFGSLGDTGFFSESTAYDPSSPYSASKAGSDHLVRAWHRTFGVPMTLSNCSNNYGAYQFPEKLIPVIIFKALAEEPLPVYGDGLNVRDWLHVEDHCRAIWDILCRGQNGETYTVGGDAEKTNISLVKILCSLLDAERPRSNGERYEELISFVTDRPGHDRRYAIDASKLKAELGWAPKYTFEDGLKQTVQWYLDNVAWVQALRDRAQNFSRIGLGKN